MTSHAGDKVEPLEGRRVFSVIGYAEATPIGQPPGDGTFVTYTRYGDADLDGDVDAADFGTLARNYGRTPALWKQGDFDYDNVVNLQDFNRLAANFGLAASGASVTASDWSSVARAVGLHLGYEVSRGGTLTVSGTPYVDEIIVDQTTLANVAVRFPDAPRVRRVVVDAGAGDDVVEMRVSLPATLIGSAGNDRLTGNGRADLISGGAGDDTVDAGGGNDTLEGLAGNDNLTGSAGTDLILGGDGADQIWGGSGADTIRAGAGNDLCMGHDGNDLIYGDAGTDALNGGAGHDRFKCADGVREIVYLGPAGFRDRVLDRDADDDIQARGN
jgi:hypothetical protein